VHSLSINAEQLLRVSESRAPAKIHVFTVREESLEKLYEGLHAYVSFFSFLFFFFFDKSMKMK
jgi:hypothetical protein